MHLRDAAEQAVAQLNATARFIIETAPDHPAWLDQASSCLESAKIVLDALKEGEYNAGV